MQLQQVEKVDHISGTDFKRNYFKPGIPVVIKDVSIQWPAYTKWTWTHFKETLGDTKVGIYNNNKSDERTPVNRADGDTTFGDYIDMIESGSVAWRIFLFNIFNHAPELTKDFTWPEHLMPGFVKRAPMLFTGSQGSVTHMHFDIDLSHILHTQFTGRKRVLLFPYEEQYKLYRKSFEVLSLVDFTNYHDPVNSKVDYTRFPALKYAKGYEVILNHGDTLYMPGGYWHHMEYIDHGFAISLRALQTTLTGKLKGAWNLLGMRHIDTAMKKIAPDTWYNWKEKRAHEYADLYTTVIRAQELCGKYRPAKMHVHG